MIEKIIAKLTLAKGEGVGHPFRGNQWTGGIGSVVHKMIDLVKTQGGFTIESKTKEPVNEGFAVGVFPLKSGQFKMSELNPQKVAGWLKDNEKALASPMIKIGAWHNKEDDTVWLDAVRVYKPDMKDVAVSMGKRANQIAIANLSAISKGDWDNAFINTGGTGEPVNIKTGQKIGKSATTVTFFDNDASPEDIYGALK